MLEVKIGDKELIETATFVASDDTPVTLRLVVKEEVLTFYMSFVRKEGGAAKTEMIADGPLSAKIILTSWDNPFGTCINPMRVGDIIQRDLFITIYAKRMAQFHACTINFYLGGSIA